MLSQSRIEELSLDELRSLERISDGKGWQYRFPPALEQDFQHYVRSLTRNARITLCLLTAGLFLLAPGVESLLLQRPVLPSPPLLLVSLGLMVPTFLALAWVQWRYWQRAVSEWLLLAGFALEVAAVEYLRFNSESFGLGVDPSISVLVPMTLLLLARLRTSRSLLFFAVYLGILAAKTLYWPNALYARLPSSWLMIVLILFSSLLAANFSKLSLRRHWAAALRLRRLANTDFLTGLPNRRAFEEHFERVVRNLRRDNQGGFLLALIDLDHFKKINDLHGHAEGDRVLRQFAETLSRFPRRPLDIAARTGGEEFAILLVNCPPDAGRRLLADLQAAVHALGIANAGSPFGELTCSIGVAVGHRDLGFAAAYRIADEQLYAAKHGGRNTVAFAEALSPA